MRHIKAWAPEAAIGAEGGPHIALMGRALARVGTAWSQQCYEDSVASRPFGSKGRDRAPEVSVLERVVSASAVQSAPPDAERQPGLRTLRRGKQPDSAVVGAVARIAEIAARADEAESARLGQHSR